MNWYNYVTGLFGHAQNECAEKKMESDIVIQSFIIFNVIQSFIIFNILEKMILSQFQLEEKKL